MYGIAGNYFDKLSNRFQDSRFRFQVCERTEVGVCSDMRGWGVDYRNQVES